MSYTKETNLNLEECLLVQLYFLYKTGTVLSNITKPLERNLKTLKELHAN